MAVAPHLVVGVLGVVLAATTGTIMATQWDDLTGTQDYVVTVTTKSQEHHPPSGEMGSGQARTVRVEVGQPNVYHVLARIVWDEGSLSGTRHTVTATLTTPAGTLFGQETRQGGTAGITFERTLLDVPASSRFSASAGSEETAFEERYPTVDDSVGSWAFTLQTNTPTQPGAAAIRYTVTMRTDHYVAALSGDDTTIR